MTSEEIKLFKRVFGDLGIGWTDVEQAFAARKFPPEEIRRVFRFKYKDSTTMQTFDKNSEEWSKRYPFVEPFKLPTDLFEI